MAFESKMLLEYQSNDSVKDVIHSRHVQFNIIWMSARLQPIIPFRGYGNLLLKALFKMSAEANETDDQNFAGFSFLTTMTITGVSILVNGISLNDFLIAVGMTFYPPKRTQFSKHVQVSAARQKLLEIRHDFRPLLSAL